ncbi:MAG TPA: 2OG-Fe(II) oxygenase [Steroidobacteraceae bacterium]|nr:2OG-Fe(II) oxygenase [Steroidobacteraceae bacterium]
MINYRTDRSSLIALGEKEHATYVANAPFSHIVIDEFFEPGAMDEVLTEVDAVDRSKRYAKFLDRETGHNKFAFFPDAVGPKTARLAQCLNSGPFLAYLEKLTGIPNLIADPSYFGGGVHWIDNGGYLEVHADFNHLKKYNLARRINLLLYLNKDWKDEYNGHLELWDRATLTKRKTVAPLFNRAVIFSTVKEALHGHPTPLSAPPGVARRSLALYYYTNTWEPAVQAHTTLYYISQKHKVKIRVSRIVRGLILDLIPPVFRKTVRAIKRTIKGEKLTELWD